jgi:hypothetical protein
MRQPTEGGGPKDPTAREVERLLRQLKHPGGVPAGPGHSGTKSIGGRPVLGGAAARTAVQRPAALPSPLLVWARVALAALLCIGVSMWPYRLCGFPLAGYFAAVAAVLVASVWAAHGTWRRRMGAAHLAALGIVLAGLALAALEILPRIGYAPVDVTWGCIAT